MKQHLRCIDLIGAYQLKDGFWRRIFKILWDVICLPSRPKLYLFIYLRTQHSISNIKSKIQKKLLSSMANEGLWATYTRPIDVYLH